jgi:hypothetical protein
MKPKTLMEYIFEVWSKDDWLKCSIGYRMYVRTGFLRRIQIRQRKLNKEKLYV